jgi:hypothetical protein
MLCPKCSSPNSNGAKECEVCGVIFAHARRAQEQQTRSQAALCAWSDHGRSCPCRGIMSEGTNGLAQWYCREHWERLHRRDPLETGNAIPEMPKSRAVIEWRAQWKARFGDKKIVQDKPIPNPLEAA